MTKPFTDASFWNDRYHDTRFAYGERPNDFLQANAAFFQPGDTVLSLAEGEGRNAVFLAQQGCEVRGVDFSETARDKARKLANEAHASITYDLADLNQYDIGTARWDGIISIFCHPSEDERLQLFQRVRRALKQDGIFLLESYHKDQLDYGTGGPKDAAHLVGLDEMLHAFDGYDILHAQEIERKVNEGTYHTGLARTTQFIARKPKATL